MFATDREAVICVRSFREPQPVSNMSPEYLKLHVAEHPVRGAEVAEEHLDHGLEGLLSAFADVTGWSLRLKDSGGVAGSTAWPSVAGNGDGSGDDFVLEPAGEALAVTPVELYRARRLASELAGLVAGLRGAQDALWRREAELAANVPVTVRGSGDEHLAERLEAVLKGGAQAVGCQAAAVYLLDEATTELKLRAAWGLPRDRLLIPARPLRGSVADLEALVGHAVVLEDTKLLPRWRAPEDFASAVCVPIASSTEPLGTLWVFCDHPRDFSAEQTNLIEIISGRIAADLQREVLMRECVQTKRADRLLVRAADWQLQRLPTIVPMLEGWEVAGWSESGEVLNSGFFDWFVPADGSLAIVVGAAEGSMVEAALDAAALHGMVRAHSESRPAAAQMLNRVHETVWGSSAGGSFASLFYASIATETGAVFCSTAGSIEGLVIGSAGLRRMKFRQPHLGSRLDEVYRYRQFCLLEGESLIVCTGLDLGIEDGAERTRRRRKTARVLRECRGGTAQDQVCAMRGLLAADLDKRPGISRTVLVVRRVGT